jgi:hypothetical protein
MASCGLNVDREGRHDPDLIRSLGATWLRIVALPDHDLSDYFRRCRGAGLKILLVLARESGGDYAALAARYATLVDAWQVGNEADLDSESSWTMNSTELASLGRAVRGILPRPHVLVTSGMASGHPEWLDGMDLSWADAVACHPYAKDAPSPDDIEDLPDADVLVRAYGEKTGLPVLVTEWGWWSDDEPRASQEVRDMVGWAGATGNCEVFFYFCISDSMVPPFGLLRANGREKPKAKPFKEQAPLAVHSLWPEIIEPVEPEDEWPDPWQRWTAEQIAAAAQCPVDAVRENWPRLVDQMWLCGLSDPLTDIAMIGTIAIESASSFRPVREAFYLGEPEPAESHRRTLRYYPYYGRGFIQLTWRENYAAYSQKVNDLWGAGGAIDLVARPDDALDPDVSAADSALYFRDHGGDGLCLIPKAAARSDWLEVRRLVYGGADPNGAARIRRIEQALGGGISPPVPPKPSKDDLIAGYELALRTLRDTTIPDLRARVDEADRIVRQFIGS